MEPVFRIRIDPELRRLRGSAAAKPRAPSAMPAPEPEPEAPDTEPVGPVGLRKLRLRRDGQRPLVFEGVPVLQDGTCCGEGSMLSLFLAADGRIAASLEARRDPSCRLDRQAYAARWVSDKEDLDRFLETSGPCPASIPPGGLAPAGMVPENARRKAGASPG